MKRAGILLLLLVAVSAMAILFAFSPLAFITSQAAQAVQAVQAGQPGATAEQAQAEAMPPEKAEEDELSASSAEESGSAVEAETPETAAETPAAEEPDATEPEQEDEPEEGLDDGQRTLDVYTPDDRPDYPYQDVDAFAEATNAKGVIGLCDATDYGSQHTLWTIDIADCVSLTDPGPEVWDQACWYEYNGAKYCMNAGWIEAQMEDRFKPANENGMTLSVVFVLSYVEGREYLIDEPARMQGYRYYQPATSGEGGDAIEAFFDFFMWRCLWDEVHIDNLILGNEINNPNEWNHTGTLDAGQTAQRYATVFLKMYHAVRRYSSCARCSVSLDHNWTWSDVGREIPGKTLLDAFYRQLNEMEEGVDWCIAYHLYPAIMGNTSMWNYRGYTPNNEYAMFIDGMNLGVLTSYVRDNFGENHRIMLTEQGVTSCKGENSQAAALAILYEAAKCDPMVDCFILNRDRSEYPWLNFVVEGHRAERVYCRLDDGNAVHAEAMERLVRETTGCSLQDWVPGYETQGQE